MPSDDPGCARCGWHEGVEHKTSPYACRQYQAPSSPFAVQLQKALAAAEKAQRK